jgi:hypothetical protein
MDSLPKMVTLYPKSAHHTKPRRNKIHAAHTKAASQLLRLSRATSLAELTASHQKRKWWKKSWEMVLSMVS